VGRGSKRGWGNAEALEGDLGLEIGCGRKKRWMDGISISTIEDFIAYPLTALNEHRYVPNRPSERLSNPTHPIPPQDLSGVFSS